MDGMIDSGSSGTFINESVCKRHKLIVFPKQRTIPLANKKQVANIIGEVIVDLNLNGVKHDKVVVEVIKNLCSDVIIGRDILKEHQRVVLNFNGPREELVIGAIPTPTPPQTSSTETEASPSTPAPPTSTETAGSPSTPTPGPHKFGATNIPPPPLFTHLSPDIKPIATKSRRQSPIDASFMRNEIARLHAQGIIRPSVSPWRAQAFVTKDDGTHKRRMVVDYSDTINRFTELDAYPMPNVLEMVEKISQYRYFATFDLKSAYHQIPIKEEDIKYTAFEVDGQLWEFTCIPFGVTNGVSAFQRTIDKVISVEQLQDTFAFVDNVTVCGRTKEELEHNVAAFHKVRIKYNLTLNDDKTVLSSTSITILGYTISYQHIRPDQNRLKPLLEMPPPTSLKAQKRIIGMFAYYSKFIENFSDKIYTLNRNNVFPVPQDVLEAFRLLKLNLRDAALKSIDFNQEFVVETDASDYCIAATLNQQGRPVAFFSHTLSGSETKHHAVEKEAAAIVESIREWRHFLIGRKFKLVTDQKSISYMFDNKRKSKIKNMKIARWRLDLSQYKFTISYRPGPENVAADTFSRIASVGHYMQDLHELHEQLCHPGVTRLSHFVRTRNLPYTQENVRTVTNNCKSCAFLKPQFLRSKGTLINATAPFQRLSVDFKGPLPPSRNGNQYLLTMIDEYSRFPFAYPCKDMSSSTVTQCFGHLFSIFGMPDMVHNDRGTDFLSNETQNYLLSKNIATSNTSRYNPQGNGQVEKLNGTLWKAVQVTLHSREMKSSEWEQVLPDALHSIRSLLCTATNSTPHERMFNFSRKSTSGKTIPTWVKPGPVYVRNHTRRSKNDPPVTPATLIHANPTYAHVQLPSGVKTTVSIRDLARQPSTEVTSSDTSETCSQQPYTEPQNLTNSANDPLDEALPDTTYSQKDNRTDNSHNTPIPTSPPPDATPDLRRSGRNTSVPKWMGDYVPK